MFISGWFTGCTVVRFWRCGSLSVPWSLPLLVLWRRAKKRTGCCPWWTQLALSWDCKASLRTRPALAPVQQNQGNCSRKLPSRSWPASECVPLTREFLKLFQWNRIEIILNITVLKEGFFNDHYIVLRYIATHSMVYIHVNEKKYIFTLIVF